MSHNQFYKQNYNINHTLFIDIDAYTLVNPLGYACNDASAVAEALTGKFGFLPDNVSLLKDSEATLGNIRSRFMQFATMTDHDDRILIFFAGHGHTTTGKRGEVGFLVPVDGTPD